MARKSAATTGTPATLALTKAGVPFRVHTYSHDPAAASYGEEAATALGIDPARVFKTLIAAVDGTLTVAVVPVTGHLDLKALANAVGGKRAVMAEASAAERSTGYVLGGISPLGQRRPLSTVLEESAAQFETIFVSAGRRGVEIELAPSDLQRLTRARSARIGRS